MKIKITKRDLRSYLLGFLSFFLLSVIVDWEGNTAAFQEGYESGRDLLGQENDEVRKAHPTGSIKEE